MNLPKGFRVIEPGEEPTGKADPAAPRELKTVWADEIELDVDKPGLIDGLLASTAMTVIYGESGAGKSFVVLDIGCHVAAGLPWYGLEVEQGIVVYIAAESPKSIERRIWAWKRKHGVERLPVLVVQSTVDLLNGDADALAALLERVKREHGRIALVVVDTLARAMTGNENSPEDMGRFVAACDRLREAGECHVIVVHHCGKDQARGARGHSGLRAATDVEGEVTKCADGTRVLTIRKNRDGEEGGAYAFRLETVELGENARGRMVTTCVTAACDPPDRAAGKEKRPLGPNERIVLEALAAALVDHGADPPPAPDIPRQVKVTTLERWRDAALRYLPQETAKKKNQAFGRAVLSLVADGRVKHAADAYWLPADRSRSQGHIGSHEASCDRENASVLTGHTVTPPFRGVTRVTENENAENGAMRPPEEGKRPTFPARQETAGKRAEAQALRAGGASFDAIAERLGVAKSCAWKWCRSRVPGGRSRPDGENVGENGENENGRENENAAENGPFVPSEDWQEGPDDAVLPPGLQIRVNMVTGHKEARRLPT